MAFQLAFDYCQGGDGKELRIEDTTGIYNVTTNPTGWDQGNAVANHPSTTNVGSSATVEVVIPGATTAVIVVASSVLPNTLGNKFVIKSQDLGLSTDIVLPDGFYKVTYKVIDSSVSPNVTYTAYKEIYLLHTIRCKLQSAKHDAVKKLSCNDCDAKFIFDVLTSQLLVDGICAAVNCGDKQSADDAFKALGGLLNNLGCKNCG